MNDEFNPLLRRKPRRPTAAELLAWKELSHDPGKFLELPNPCPYVSLRGPGGEPGIELGLKGSF